MIRQLLTGIALGAVTTLTWAQNPVALLSEGEALTGAFTGDSVSGLNVAGINSAGGYAVTISTANGLSAAWGDVTNSGTPDVILAEQTVGMLVQTSWESLSFGIGNGGEIIYSASGTGGPVGGFDSMWRDLVPIAVEGDPIPTLAGKFWRFASRPKAIDDGTAVFVGGITSMSGGTTEQYGLFENDTLILTNGDVVAGLPATLTVLGNALSFDFQYSRDGSQYLVEVTMEGFSSTEDNAMVLTGSGLMIGGSLVRELTPVPVSAGGIGGEAWDNFDIVSVLNDGQYIFTGDTNNANTAVDEILVKNGTIVYREGDTVDGFTFGGSIEGAVMNAGGDVAYIWDVDDSGSNVEVLYINDTLLLKEGDAIDLDGDGVPEAGSAIADFTGGSQLALSDGGTLYFIADVTPPGGGANVEIFYRLDGAGAPGANYCISVVNSTGLASTISASGSSSIAANDLVLTATNLPGQPGIFIAGPTQAQLPFFNGFLCIDPGGLQRFSTVNTPAGGAITEAVDLATSALGGLNAAAGSTYNYQRWNRDPAGGGGNANFSDGLAVAYVP